MQISTNYLFDRASAQMSQLQNDLAKSQAQISAQKQVLNPSDAPDQAASITRLKSVIGRNDNYASALDTVQARLETESTTLSSASDVLIRIKELAIQANNGTQGSTSRAAIATEMQGLRDQLLSLANSTDTTGNYVFSGSKVRTPAFTADSTGAVSYQGDQTRMHVAVGDQRTIAVNRPGTNAFVRVVRTAAGGTTPGTGFFQSIDDLIKGVKDGTSTVMQRGLTEMDALHQGVVLAQAEAGTDLKVVDQQRAVLDDTKLTLKTVLSNVEDLDMATAITNMQKLMLSLEAAQSSFAKVSQLSLFKYLG
ncbi:MAG: flagellar hook-associated protein FlgL [Burkholderiales bacterium]|nr:flagellar hook-associated protein FlgL [Burkholderiales bacterium]